MGWWVVVLVPGGGRYRVNVTDGRGYGGPWVGQKWSHSFSSLTSALFWATCPVGPWSHSCWPHIPGTSKRGPWEDGGRGPGTGGGNFKARLLGSLCPMGKVCVGRSPVTQSKEEILQVQV